MPVPTPKRGAIPSSRSRLAAATPHKAIVGAPPSFVVIPTQLSDWGNIYYGDCVTAEEAFAKACNSPEIFIPHDDAIAWATKNNILNGANISGVLQLMQGGGFVENGITYDDGPYQSVDWTNAPTLQSAISTGPVKIGVGGNQLDTLWQAANGNSGWFATGFTTEPSEDHCTSLCGYGTISWLAQQLNVSVPAQIDGTQPGYAMFTWGSIGIIDVPSMLAITYEAWVRQPTTVTWGGSFNGKVTLNQTSAQGPALASTPNMLHLAWKGNGNDNLNVACSFDGGMSFTSPYTSPQTSPMAPALCGQNGMLFIAWKGDGNDNLNVAQVNLSSIGATGFSNQVVLSETSPLSPSLASLNGCLYLAWKGDGNDNLNVKCSLDNGATFGVTYTSPETSAQAPTLGVAGNNVYISWKGDGNDSLNIAQVSTDFFGNTITGFVNKVTLADTSQLSPALASNGDSLYLAWTGDGNDLLNVESTANGGASFNSKLISVETSPLAPALTSMNGSVYIAWTGNDNLELNVASVSGPSKVAVKAVQAVAGDLVLSHGA